MQQFVVPQFIDIEDKIIGPITVRQFIILLVGGGIIFVVYKLSDFSLFVVEGILIFALTGTFAFLKINGRPIQYFLMNFFQTLRKPKLRIWNKQLSIGDIKATLELKEVKLPPQIVVKPKVGSSRLAELALIVDTGGIYRGEG